MAEDVRTVVQDDFDNLVKENPQFGGRLLGSVVRPLPHAFPHY